MTLTSTTRLSLGFGYSRDATPVHLDYGTAMATETLDSNRAFDLHPSDLHNRAATFSSDNLSWTKTLLDKHHASFKVVVDPKNVEAGTYQGTLDIVGDNITAAPVQLSVSFRQHGDVAKVALFVLILIAALAGLGLKWLAGAGTKLQRAEQRLRILRQRLSPYGSEAIPDEYRAALDEVEQLISDRDATSADSRLTELETGLGKVVSVARWYAWVEGIVRAAHETIAQDQRLAADRAALEQTLQTAAGDAAQIKDDSWPDADGQATARRNAFTPLESYLAFLDHFAAADATTRQQDPLHQALVLYQTGQYEAARNCWTTADAHPAQPVTSGLIRGEVTLHNLEGNIRLLTMTGVPGGSGGSPVDCLIEHAALIAATAGGVLAAGVIVATVSPTFHGLADWARFAAAGFGAGLTGATLSDFAAKKTPAP